MSMITRNGVQMHAMMEISMSLWILHMFRQGWHIKGVAFIVFYIYNSVFIISDTTFRVTLTFRVSRSVDLNP